jgi:hypothetical protein
VSGGWAPLLLSTILIRTINRLSDQGKSSEIKTSHRQHFVLCLFHRVYAYKKRWALIGLEKDATSDRDRQHGERKSRHRFEPQTGLLRYAF